MIDHRHRGTSPTARAFTLVELLVVLAIIAVLISLLMPALASARKAAVNLQCQTSLKQVVLAAIAYAESNRSVAPIPYYDSAPSGERAWFQMMRKTGVLSNAEHMRCPLWQEFGKNTDQIYGMRYPQRTTTTYRALRTDLLPVTWFTLSTKTPRPTGRHPSDYLVFADSRREDSEKGQWYLIADSSNTAVTIYDVHGRHLGGKANGAFLDGHVEIRDKEGFVKAGFLASQFWEQAP
jgi:prepilin-type N-terminal cleavage/methylation domain-containing protein/prepilin-type processing-associated H-X9-DG protein